MKPNERTRERLSATADARSSDRSERRLARFVWRDPRSGELLEVVLHGSEAFFAELETLGFERTAGLDPEAFAGLGGGSSGVRSSAERTVFRSTSGSTPSSVARASSVRSLDGFHAFGYFERAREYGC
jgi:hypothetical protein